jgi:hypothetical protein
MGSMDETASNQVRCPTCRALQEWSDSCRRCRSDLRLLRAAQASYDSHRRRCLLNLDAGRPDLALGHAVRCHDLRPDGESRRLLALCALVGEDWEAALRLVRAVSETD